MAKVFTQLPDFEYITGRTIKSCIYNKDFDTILIIFSDKSLVCIQASVTSSWSDPPEPYISVDNSKFNWENFEDDDLIKVGYFTKEELKKTKKTRKDEKRKQEISYTEKAEKHLFDTAKENYERLKSKYEGGRNEKA